MGRCLILNKYGVGPHDMESESFCSSNVIPFFYVNAL